MLSNKEKHMLYKNRYCIAIYDDDDEIVAVLDNYKELSEYCDINERVSRSILTRVLKGTQKKILLDKTKYCKIFLIDMVEEDDE